MSFSIAEFVENCRAAANERQEAAAQAVAVLVQDAVRQPRAISEALKACNNPRVLYQAKDLTVLNVTLPPGLQSPPHNHTIWAVVGIYEGQEDNLWFDERAGRLAVAERREVKAADVLIMHENIIHAISNPLASVTRGIHVYGGHLDDAPRSLWDPDTHEVGPFTETRMGELMRKLKRRGSETSRLQKSASEAADSMKKEPKKRSL